MSTAKDTCNINTIAEIGFQQFIDHSLKSGGSHILASKSHGKTRLLFSMAKELQQKSRVIVFDGSDSWLYWFSRIPVFNVTERDIQLIKKVNTTQDLERYELRNWQIVKLALQNYDSLLFRLKTRKPSKRGFFVRTIINYLDALQRAEKEQNPNHEPNRYISFFIEEAQDCFNSRSTIRMEAEEFLTVFNEARNQHEAFFTASQRANDFSKTIRTKQLYVIGKIPESDKTSDIRRIEKQSGLDFSKIPARKWFFEGKLLSSPEWKQSGRPYKINYEVKKQFQQTDKPERPEPELSLRQKLLFKLFNVDASKLKAHNEPDEDFNESEEIEFEEDLGLLGEPDEEW